MLATGTGLSPAHLTSRVAHEVIPGASVRVRAAEWGAYLVTGSNWVERGHWLVIGHPSAGPWGLPDAGRSLDSVVEDLELWGPHAMSMCAGPAVALDLATGVAHVPLNRILAPGPRPDDHSVWTTTVNRRPARAEAQPVADTSPGFRFSRLVDEITSRLPDCHDGPSLLDSTDDRDSATVDGVDWSRGSAVRSVVGDASQLVLHPHNLEAMFASPFLYARAQEQVVPLLAWRAERIGKVLHAPFLERPVLDQIGFGRGIEVVA